MTYRVEYDGGDVEIPTLNAAIESAKQAIAADAGPISEWVVEHDDTINDWFVRGLVNGEPVGGTAVVSGPEMATAPAPHRPASYVASSSGRPPVEGSMRVVTFDGATPAEAFGRATAWLAGRPELVEVGDVGWHQGTVDTPHQLRIHVRLPADY